MGSRHPRADAAASGEGVALGFLPFDKEAIPEATEEYREDTAVSREARIASGPRHILVIQDYSTETMLLLFELS